MRKMDPQALVLRTGFKGERLGAAESGGRPRVCWIENGPGLFSTGVSGGSVRVEEVANAWQGRGVCRQFMVTTRGGHAIHSAIGLHLPTLIVRASLFSQREFSRLLRLWSYVVSTIDIGLHRRQLPGMDVVITASDYFCDVVPAVWLKRRNPELKWIAWVHHLELPPRERPGKAWLNWCTRGLQRWSLRRIAAYADDVWVYSSPAGRDVARALADLGVASERIYGMKNGVDFSAVSMAGESAKEADAVMVGLRTNKGLYDIIPVWQAVQDRRPGTTLRLIGCRSDLDPIWPSLQRLGLDRFIRLVEPEGEKNFFFKDDLYVRMKAARVMFAPSREEGWGIAVCEAMACGLPVLAYDLPVYREIYGNAIRTVPVGDHVQMAARLCELLDDEERSAEYTRRGLDCARGYDWALLAEEDWRRVEQVRPR